MIALDNIKINWSHPPDDDWEPDYEEWLQQMAARQAVLQTVSVAQRKAEQMETWMAALTQGVRGGTS